MGGTEVSTTPLHESTRRYVPMQQLPEDSKDGDTHSGDSGPLCLTPDPKLFEAMPPLHDTDTLETGLSLPVKSSTRGINAAGKDEPQKASTLQRTVEERNPRPTICTTRRNVTIDNVPSLQAAVDGEEWEVVLRAIQQDPNAGLTEQQIMVHFQGEKTFCSLLHAVVATRHPCVELVEVLATREPALLTKGDRRGDRTPLHLLLIKGVDTLDLVKTLVCPQALLHQDAESSTPVSYACRYCHGDVIKFLADECPEACRLVDWRDHLPLHLLCSRGWDADDVVALDVFRHLIDLFPEALTFPDRNQRVPIHCACDCSQPRGDIVSLLINRDSSTLVLKDKSGHTPLGLAKLLSSGNDNVVFTLLKEKTAQEKRKQLSKRLLSFRVRKQKKESPKVDLYDCYG